MKSKTKIHLIGNAHLDPVWLWRWSEGFAETIQTFRAAVEILEETDDAIFTCSSACYYEWVEENDPETFEKVKKFVKEGRFVPVNGWFIQPDCNIPDAESFARQALYSQRYYAEKFGITCKTGYNVDSFGHNGMLPQLLKLGGMDNYVMMRPNFSENPKIPKGAFIWKSPDGSEVLAYRLLGEYTASGSERLDAAVKAASENIENASSMLFYGVGNHGGGITRFDLNYLREYMNRPDSPECVFSSPDAFFEEIAAEKGKLPVWSSDMQHHASGCYAVNGSIKRINRQCENIAAACEKWDTAAEYLFKLPAHTKQFEEIWKKIMFNQFHDILAGCCIKEAYDDQFALGAAAVSDALTLQTKILCRIAANIDTYRENVNLPSDSKDGVPLRHQSIPAGQPRPIVVFNSLCFPVTKTVTVHDMAEKITDDAGSEIPFELVRSSEICNQHAATLFEAELPAFGYRTYWVTQADNTQISMPTYSCRCFSLENNRLKIDFDSETGAITSFFDKESGSRLIAPDGILPIVVDDHETDTWAHNVFKFDKVLGNMKCVFIEKTAEGEVEERIFAKYRWKDSYITQEFSLSANSNCLNVKCKTLWKEPRTILKLNIPLANGASNNFAGMSAGEIIRPCNGEEEPFCGYAGASFTGNDGKNSGIVFISDSHGGYSCERDNFRPTLLRNAIFADHYSDHPFSEEYYDYTDEGVSRFIYSLCPMPEKRCETVEKVMLLNNPPIVVEEGYHKGALPREKSFASSDNGSVLLTVLKRPENKSDGYIIRLCELSGEKSKAKISVSVCDFEAEITLEPYQILNLHIYKNGTYEVVNFIEEPLNRNYERIN